MAEAYLLIRHLAWVGNDQWEMFARQLAGKGGGVLAVEAEDGHIHGVAAYLPVASLKHGKALRVEAIAAFELGHASPVRNLLSAALDDLARSEGCAAVMVNLDSKGMLSPHSRRRCSWESLGLTAETIEFVRRLEGGANSNLGTHADDQVGQDIR
jgi:hypothetical protein